MFRITHEQTARLARDYRVRQLVTSLEDRGLACTLADDDAIALRDAGGGEATVRLDAHGHPIELHTALGRVFGFTWDAQAALMLPVLEQVARG